MRDYYEILGVNKDSTPEEIYRAYRNRVKKYHPDKHRNTPLFHQAEKRMKIVNEAYEVLSDPQKRKEYDEKQQINANLANENTKIYEDEFEWGREEESSREKKSSEDGSWKTKLDFLACSEHPQKKAKDKCSFCSSPLCAECAGRFSVASCSDCFLEYQQAYLKQLKKPLLTTGVFGILGLIFGLVFTFDLILVIFFIFYFPALYWGWNWLSNSRLYKSRNRFSSGALGVIKHLFLFIFLLTLGWLPGIVITFLRVAAAASRFYDEASRVKKMEQYIARIK